MRQRSAKKKILSLLTNHQWDTVRDEIGSYPPRDCLHALFSALCSTNAICKWHGVSSFGIVVPTLAKEDLESARVVMRRFLWCLNDESGGIGWGIPEAMGEVLAEDATLFEEYSKLLLSYMREDGPEIFQDGNFLELPALQQGLLWAVARLLESRRDLLLEMGVEEDLEKYLLSDDRIVRAFAALCLGKCGSTSQLELLKRLSEDQFAFELFRNKKLEQTTVAALATEAIEKIKLNEKCDN